MHKILEFNSGFFFNIFEKTQARKNSTAQKTQRFFRPKLNQLVAIVVLFARNPPKNVIFGAFLPDFPSNTVFFFQKTNTKSSKLQGF